ncbi:isoleucine--tRNA ligase [Desulfobacula sp.]|uniref:isoleucine--tRNA ligase n=1 Tax=Desulfobacula sp. TaxID=2593537 RepID=UPI001DF3DA45|nr:isoleucine--tRNA ligase [Desulfobacula sp.]MBT3485700.1 isoleucine--tRNA ligase [Desulfobacula sp.]MBT4026598.1 isoleucine--tRNA ligase [Desulfobacula sp.]MBT4200431.1 isoleucine--tRNA ligase [Desulfobacula sp.]MBT4508156.1 isoleucine--tRNA ligase [Desulfobacula sp.]
MKTIPSSVRFPDVEEEILEYWKTQGTFQKSLDKNRGNDPYIFYDGPPFATGMPHYGHILTSYIKDTIPRYFTMKGRFVDRRWGWDCHGLPIEYEIEKKLNISGKAAIEAFGIDRFNKECSDIVLKYADDWCAIIDRIGRWVDFDRKYQTMDLDYMESVLWIFKLLHQKGLIYESLKVVAYCNRCQTPLSNFETGLDDSYRIKDDPSVTVAFVDKKNSDISYLAWTTTPWTLPSNLSLAVHPDIDYCLIESGKWGKVILAKERIDYYAGQLLDHKILEQFKGKYLIGKEYVPLFDFADNENAFRILEGNFIDTKTGTGIVHIAPAFGEDDFNICSKNSIQSFNPVGLDGRFTEKAGFLKGMDVFESNKPIIAYLKEKGLLFLRENYRHSYPHCWRCDNPLIYRTISSWYVKVTEFKDKMVKANQDINWIPGHIKTGRFGQWLEGARDWAISRNRFWGSPIPVWKCDQCKTEYVPESIKDLEDRSGQSITNLHRPDCDNIFFPCTQKGCSGQFARIPEVLDCWFESGAMPYAQVHFPFENKAMFENTFPASFIVEYIAQTRGWFYTLMVESAAIMGKHPFENAICHGVILADDGRKMSKSLKNFPDPMKVIDEHGSDALRIYLLSSAVVKGTDIRFSETGVREAVRRYLIPLWNSFHFFTSYSGFVKGYSPKIILSGTNTEDRHILSELENLKTNVSQAIENYDLPKCYSHILYFVETLSGWYIRNNRERFWVQKINEDAANAFNTLYTVLFELSTICAPFIPFTMEYIYRHFTDNSVHLADWADQVPERIDTALNQDVLKIRSVIEGGRRIREKNRINLRQPLPNIRVSGIAQNTLEQFTDLLKSQLNVKQVLYENKPDTFSKKKIQPDTKKLGPVLRKDLKKVLALIQKSEFEYGKDGQLCVDQYKILASDYTIGFQAIFEDEDLWYERQLVVSLCLSISEELKIEGTARNLNRYIQDLRKELKLSYDDRIILSIEAVGIYGQSISSHKRWLMEQSLAVDLKNTVEEIMFEKNDAEGQLKIQVQKAKIDQK